MPNGRSVGIIGAGPSGLAATGYLSCLGYQVDVYDKLPKPGGLMVFGIPAESMHETADKLTRVFGTFHLMHFIGYQLAAVDILDHVPIEKTTSNSAGQPSDIPTPHLIGSVCAMRCQHPAFRGFGSAATRVLISGL